MRILEPPTGESEASFEHPLAFSKVGKICSIELALLLSIDPELALPVLCLIQIKDQIPINS
jgi:hypothetical protein